MLYSHTIKLVRFYEGVDGLKTGYTNEAGYCLTATALRNNMRLIAVVFGEPDNKIRNEEISKMLDYGYNVYETMNLLSSDSVVGKIEVTKGTRKYSNVVPVEDLNIIQKKGAKKRTITYNVNIENYKAPIKKGEPIGIINAIEDGKVIRSVKVTVQMDVEKANIFQLYFRYVLDIIRGDINIKIK